MISEGRNRKLTIGNRIKQVRDLEGKNQRDFASSIKIGQSTLAMFENGQREPKDIHIEQIHLKYGISEKWLRNGEGEMKIEDCKDNRYLSNVGKLQRADDETIMRWVNAIAETDPKVLKQIEEFMKKLLEIQED